MLRFSLPLGSFFFCCLFLSFPLPAFSLTAQEVLDKVEATRKAHKDNIARVKMTIIDKKGYQKERGFRLWSKTAQEDMVLIIFSQPAEVKDIGFLSLAEDRMYLYLPAYRKVRRIASHTKRQSFVGSDLSYEDISPADYKKNYLPRLLSQGRKEYILELMRKQESDRTYPRLVMKVDGESFLPTRIEMYDQEDKLWKEMKAEQLEQIEGYWLSRRIEVEDKRKGSRTIMFIEEIDYDVGLEEEFFTQRRLKTGGR